MKKFVAGLILSVQSIVLAIALGLHFQDLPRQWAKNTTAFTVMQLNERIYGSGSYMKYKGKTYLVTNKHVCNAGIQITTGFIGFMSGTIAKRITTSNEINRVLHIDRQYDICILETNRTDGFSLADEDAQPLDKVFLIGHPRGQATTIREGRIVENKNVCLEYDNFPNKGTYKACRESYSISATSYPGNSGSAVLNEDGEVIGVLYAGNIKYSTEGFIVKVSQLKEVFKRYVR